MDIVIGIIIGMFVAAMPATSMIRRHRDVAADQEERELDLLRREGLAASRDHDLRTRTQRLAQERIEFDDERKRFVIDLEEARKERRTADAVSIAREFGDQRDRAAFDVVALPAETPLINAGRAAGKTVITGAEVATLQALEQFVLYTGIRPTDAQVRDAEEFIRAAQ